MEKGLISILAEYIKMDSKKLEYFINNFGLRMIIDNPSIMGVTANQAQLISDFKKMISYQEGESKNE